MDELCSPGIIALSISSVLLERRLALRSHTRYVAHKTKQCLHVLLSILSSQNMSRRLGTFIVRTRVLSMNLRDSCIELPSQCSLIPTHLLDRGLRWAPKTNYLISNKTIRTALGVRFLKATIKSSFRKCYGRSNRFQVFLIAGLGLYRSVPGNSCTRPWSILQLA